ncbi:hypothetical protein DL767_004002 [Monosporascus sp. MG133]|nr:hypothetical protein DL767_004002 [Monosporascus sp. MG133]
MATTGREQRGQATQAPVPQYNRSASASHTLGLSFGLFSRSNPILEPASAIALFCNILNLGEKAVGCVKAFKRLYDSPKGLHSQDDKLQQCLADVRLVCDGLTSDASQLTANGADHQSKDAIYRVVGRMQDSLRKLEVTIKTLVKHGDIEEHHSMLKNDRRSLSFILAANTHRQLLTLIKQADMLRGDQDDIKELLRSVSNQTEPVSNSMNTLEIQSVFAKASEGSKLPQQRLYVQRILTRLNYSDLAHEQLQAPSYFREARRGEVSSYEIHSRPLRHENAIEALKVWANEKHLVVAKFFFWKPGDWRQNSIRGLVRGLLADVISQKPELAEALFTVASLSWDTSSPLSNGDVEVS